MANNNHEAQMRSNQQLGFWTFNVNDLSFKEIIFND